MLKDSQLVRRVKIQEEQSDFTVGMTLPQSHGAGGPGGSGYPSFEVNGRFWRKTANKGIVKAATMAVESARLVFSMFNSARDDGMFL